MSKGQSIEIKVGAMVGIGLALFMITTLLLGGGKKVFTSTYFLRAQYDAVVGITPGSVVQVLGIPVGNVSEVRFSSDGTKLEVVMQIESQYKQRITKGSMAGMRTQGALGDKYIYITPGPAGEALQDGDLLESEKGGDIFTTIAEKAADIQRVFDAFKEAEKLLASLNADGKAAELMPNLVKSTHELHLTMAELKGTLHDLRGGSLAHMDNILRKLDKGSGTLGALINDPEIHERLKSVLGGSSRSQFMKNQVRETIKTEK